MAKSQQAGAARRAETRAASARAGAAGSPEAIKADLSPDAAEPESLSRAELIEEVRRLRAESGDSRQGGDLDGSEPESAAKRLARLEAAILAMPVGFMLCDENDRLVIKNNRFQLHDSRGERDRPGTSFEDIVRFGLEIGVYLDGVRDPETWLRERLQKHREPDGPVVQLIRDGRHIQVEERRLADGSTVGTYADVSRIKQTETALDQARLLAEKANRTKASFLANMSHELRTPLNAIIGFLELLLSDTGRTLDPERQREYIVDIDMAAKHLNAIITDILDISRVESGQYDISLESVTVSETCEQIGRMFEPQADEKGLTLDLKLETTLDTTIQADRRAFRQMLINLVSNALRYSEAGGQVEIGARATSDSVEVWVGDQGIGIAASEVAEVVKPFYRGLQSKAGDSGGLGLGLALTNMLIELHNGSLHLDSQPGQGTTATLRFSRDDQILSASVDRAFAGPPGPGAAGRLCLSPSFARSVEPPCALRSSFPLFSPVDSLPGIGPRFAGLLEQLAGPHVVDLCWHLPSGLIDRRYAPKLARGRAGAHRHPDAPGRRSSGAAQQASALSRLLLRRDGLDRAGVLPQQGRLPGQDPARGRDPAGQRQARGLQQRSADDPPRPHRPARGAGRHDAGRAGLSADRRPHPANARQGGGGGPGAGARAAGVAGAGPPGSSRLAGLAGVPHDRAWPRGRGRPLADEPAARPPGLRRVAGQPARPGPGPRPSEAPGRPVDPRRRPAPRGDPRGAAVPAHGLSDDRRRGDPRRHGLIGPHAAPAAGRRRQRQDRGRAARHGRSRRGRRPGRADGTDRDPRPPAPRHRQGPGLSRRHRSRAPDRPRQGQDPRGDPRAHRQRRGRHRGRHPRAVPGGRRVPQPGAGRDRRAASLRRPPAPDADTARVRASTSW